MLDKVAHEEECPYAICQRMIAPLQSMIAPLQSELVKRQSELITLEEQHHRLRRQVEALVSLEGERALELGCERDVRGQRKRKGVKRPKGGHPGGPHDA